MTELTKPIIEFVFDSQQDVLNQITSTVKAGQKYTDFEAYTYLKHKSNQTNKTYNFVRLGTPVEIKLGQFLTSCKQLQYQFNWSRDKVRYWLNKMVKKGVITIQSVSNKVGYKIGTLITCNKFVEFRNNLNSQYQDQKNLKQNYTHRFAYSNQTEGNTTPNKIIKENTYKNNIENSLTFEANKKLYDFNSKILVEKRKQGEELLILRNSLKKEKTLNNQLKSLKRFEVKGQVKSDTVVFDWSFQDTAEYIQIAEKLKSFGFSQFTINKIWWKHSLDSVRLQDYIDYTQMKYEQGKVQGRQKFLYHSLQAKYDLGELEKMRWEAKSREEKYRIEEERRAEVRKIEEEKDRLEFIQKEKNIEELKMIRKWIQENQSHIIFEQFLENLEIESKFLYGSLCRRARTCGIFKVLDFVKSDKTTLWDLSGTGLYFKIYEEMKVLEIA